MMAGPIMLSLLGFFIGLFPETISGALISPAVSAVRAEATEVKLALWHGINPVLALSVMTVTLGVVLFLLHRPIRGALAGRQVVFPWTAEAWYDLSVSGMLAFAKFQTRILQNGYLRVYLLMMVATLLGLAGYVLVTHVRIPAFDLFSAVRLHEAVLAAVVMAATIMAVTAKSRLAAIVALGIVGYGVAVIFILFGAPDLAMTQFSIETLSVVLFVLVLTKLPRFADYSTRGSRVRDLMVAAAAGLLMTGLVALVTSTPVTTHVASYFAESSWLLAKGRNIVNVILVDFRAMDTLGEITVLALAAIGAFALLKLRMKGDDAS
jgi:multicomponent Na+:H+ antiporter subunit A